MRTASLTILALVLMTSTALAKRPKVRTPQAIGVGAGLGTTTLGVSGKYFLTEGTSIHALVGTRWDQIDNVDANWFSLQADYLLELQSFGNPEIDLGWYAGPGVSANISDRFDLEADISGVVGAAILFNTVPLEFFFEYRPTLRFATFFASANPARLDFARFGVGIHIFFGGNTDPKPSPPPSVTASNDVP